MDVPAPSSLLATYGAQTPGPDPAPRGRRGEASLDWRSLGGSRRLAPSIAAPRPAGRTTLGERRPPRPRPPGEPRSSRPDSLPMAAAGEARRGSAASAMPTLARLPWLRLRRRLWTCSGQPRVGSAPSHVTQAPTPHAPPPDRAPAVGRRLPRCHGHRPRSRGACPDAGRRDRHARGAGLSREAGFPRPKEAVAAQAFHF
jgi:hypothetical protein